MYISKTNLSVSQFTDTKYPVIKEEKLVTNITVCIYFRDTTLTDGILGSIGSLYSPQWCQSYRRTPYFLET